MYPQRGLYPEDAYELEGSGSFLIPAKARAEARAAQFARHEAQRKLHCIPDMPGSLLLSGIAMAACMGVSIIGMVWLVNAARRANDDDRSIRASTQPMTPRFGPNDAVNQGTSRKKPNLDVLDGMRTLLVTYVILMHYPKNIPFGLGNLVVMGWPMQFFFVLSGFILYYVNEDKVEKFSFASGAKLVTRRLVRLIPLYQVAISIEFLTAVALGLNGKPFIAWPIQALFLQTLFSFKVCGEMQPGKEWALNYLHFAQNGLGWFTAALIWMSCLFPFLYNYMRKAGSTDTWAMLILTLICRSIPEILHPTWGHWGQGSMHLFVFLPLRLLEFAAGMLTAQAVGGSDPESSARTFRGWGWIFDGLLLIGLATVHWPMLFGHEKNTGYGVFYTGDFYVTAIWCLVCAAARLATEQGVNGFMSTGPLYFLISLWPLRALAQYSFAAYILQSTVLTFWDPGFPWNVFIVWVLGFLASIVIEKPLRKWVDVKLSETSKKLPRGAQASHG
jgi:peptidoglycan/LPS O-acetylase OafA/YrhL